ncbi:MAG: riboflavin synthase [Elusimicrobia bacterium]|nr:riboflavin synthase [Elusimicrobiota bacterium]
MFTGLIQDVGRILEVRKAGVGLCLAVAASKPWDPALELGESVAVDGVCLTLKDCRAGRMRFDVLGESARLTGLKDKKAGGLVNLERALRLEDRLGGHLVTGHVDGQGLVSRLGREGGDRVLCVTAAAPILAGIVLKGSIAIDGVSLTVAKLSKTSFEARIIPFTWEHTALRALREGDRVNLETDLVGKHVQRWLESGRSREGPKPGALTWEKLRAAGF